MFCCSRIEDRKVITQVARPCEQIERVLFREILDGPVTREIVAPESRHPLIAWVSVQVNDDRVRKVSTKPWQSEVDTIELKDGSRWGGVD